MKMSWDGMINKDVKKSMSLYVVKCKPSFFYKHGFAKLGWIHQEKRWTYCRYIYPEQSGYSSCIFLLRCRLVKNHMLCRFAVPCPRVAHVSFWSSNLLASCWMLGTFVPRKILAAAAWRRALKDLKAYDVGVFFVIMRFHNVWENVERLKLSPLPLTSLLWFSGLNWTTMKWQCFSMSFNRQVAKVFEFFNNLSTQNVVSKSAAGWLNAWPWRLHPRRLELRGESLTLQLYLGRPSWHCSSFWVDLKCVPRLSMFKFKVISMLMFNEATWGLIDIDGVMALQIVTGTGSSACLGRWPMATNRSNYISCLDCRGHPICKNLVQVWKRVELVTWSGYIMENIYGFGDDTWPPVT